MRTSTWATSVLVILVNLQTCYGKPVEYCRELDKRSKPVTVQFTTLPDRFNFQCCFTGDQIIWKKNGQPIDDVQVLLRRYQKIEKNRVLLIYNLRDEDSGNYSCTVKRGNATYWNKTILFTFIPRTTVSPAFSVLMREIPVSTEGENATLVCHITSSIKPNVYWFKVNTTANLGPGSGKPLPRDGQSKLEDQEKDLFVSRYHLKNVTVGDSGVYRCLATAYRPRRITADANGTLTVMPKEEPTALASSRTTPNKSVVIGITLPVVILIVSVVAGLLMHIRKKQNEKKFQEMLSHRNHPGPGVCPASKHNVNAKDDTGDDRCICFEVNDVFISYNNKDGEWVRGELYDRLTQTFNYKVCVDVHDFLPGEFITDNIANSIWRSRKTLLVVSRNFIKSDWTRFEIAVAQGRRSKGESILVMIVLERLKQNQLPPTLRHYYKTRTYLEWFNQDVRQNFWERLSAAIGPTLAESDDVNANVDVNVDTDENTAEADGAESDGEMVESIVESNADAVAVPVADVDADGDVDADADIPLLKGTENATKSDGAILFVSHGCNGKVDVK